MTTWITVLVSSALAYLLKLTGYLVPARWADGPRTARVTTLLPVALLSALIATQAFTGPGGRLALDARVAGLAAAVALLLLRANFLVVVLGAALVAAALRAMGWG